MKPAEFCWKIRWVKMDLNIEFHKKNDIARIAKKLSVDLVKVTKKCIGVNNLLAESDDTVQSSLLLQLQTKC